MLSVICQRRLTVTEPLAHASSVAEWRMTVTPALLQVMPSAEYSTESTVCQNYASQKERLVQMDETMS
jgi:hypothetical protein